MENLNVNDIEEIQNMIKNIPNLWYPPLEYIFEKYNLKHKSNTIWIEFGVQTGSTINIISKFTDKNVYGFDSFEGLPEKWRDGFEKGSLSNNGILPVVNNNVVLIKGWFNETMPNFLNEKCINDNKKISFIHMDCDLYSSTNYIFDIIADHLDDECIIVFDELINYPGFTYDNGELKAFYQFLKKNKKFSYEWIGMNGEIGWVTGQCGCNKVENVAVKLIKKII